MNNGGELRIEEPEEVFFGLIYSKAARRGKTNISVRRPTALFPGTFTAYEFMAIGVLSLFLKQSQPLQF